jgi:hypothetical protein
METINVNLIRVAKLIVENKLSWNYGVAITILMINTKY